MTGDVVYLDTSGMLAMLDADDEFHEIAAGAWQKMLAAKLLFTLTDYVRLECWSLIQRRLGMEALRDYHRRVLPMVVVDSVGEGGFVLLAQQVTLANRRDLSLVDLSSFACMQRRDLRYAFAFDKHFGEQGFVTPEEQAWPFG